MADVFLCQRGQLDNRSRRDLRVAGVVVVEVDDPSACQFVRSSELVTADDMLWAALDALNTKGGYGDGGAQREQLARNLLRIVVDARHPRADPPKKASHPEES